MTAAQPLPHRRHPRAIPANDELIRQALGIAVAVRDGNPVDLAALIADIKHPTSLILTLAALIDTDSPMRRWWEEGADNPDWDPTPCGRCDEPLGRSAAGPQSPYHRECRKLVRRDTNRLSHQNRRDRTDGAS